MGIYDQASGFNFSLGDSKKWIIIILAVIVILAVASTGFFAMQGFRPSALGIKFEKNPIKTDESTKVTVKVTNIGTTDALNVPVNLRAKESSELQIYPFNESFSGKIPNLSAGTSREVTFTLNPVRSILPGTYILVATSTINGEYYEKEAVLTVQG